MSRKTKRAAVAAVAASMMAIVFSADGSGAFAQDAVPGVSREPAAANLTDEVVPLASASDADATANPVFVSQEVVQELPSPASSEGAVAHEAGNLRALVASMPAADALSEQMQCLASAVYFESRGEPLAGQLAVAQVIVNRAESSRFPSSYCGVVYQRAQFSFVKNGQMPHINTGSKAWKRASAIARIAHEGHWQSEADDSLYFHAKYARPRWARAKLARATISSHVFYR